MNPSERRAVRAVVTAIKNVGREKMSTFGEDLIQPLNEALAHAKGEGSAMVHAPVTPREVRKQVKLTQAQMTPLMGMSLSGYRKWEQGTRRVSGPAATLLHVLQKEPEAVRRTLIIGERGIKNVAKEYSRREIPNPQIKDAADQYEKARQILSTQPPGTGVLLPMMNAAAMAIELYLKCLAGEVIFAPEGDDPKSSVVCAQTSTREHEFSKIFCKIDEDLRCQMRSSYLKTAGGELNQHLSTIEDAFVVSHYPYEPDKNLSRASLQILASISKFLRNFVASLESRETIQWKGNYTGD